MAIQRVRECKVCNIEFTTSQISAKYCPDHRKASSKKPKSDRKLATATNRVLRISQSDEWMWIARECKRAGTVECLQGVDIVSLLAVHKAKSKTGSYNNVTKKSQFHLCHISPARGKNSIGLLHHLNLFIAGSLPNQKFSNKSYEDKGLCIPKNNLKAKWKISDKASIGTILKKVVDYLGPVLIEYAKENPIDTSARFGLAKWIIKNDPTNNLPLSKLEAKSTTELRALRADVEQKEVFSINYSAKRSFIVLLDECQRLSAQLPTGEHQSNIAFMVPVLQVAIAWLSRQQDQQGLAAVLSGAYGVKWEPLQLRDGMNASSFRDWINFTAFEALQGAPVDRKAIRSKLSEYLEVTSLTPDYSGSNSSIQKHYADNYSLFAEQVPVIKDAIIRLGLVDKIMLAEEIARAEVAAYEESMFANFPAQQCENEFDYSTTHYTIEDDYVPNPHLVEHKEPVFCPF